MSLPTPSPPSSLLSALFPSPSTFAPPKDFPIQLQIAFGDSLVTGGNTLPLSAVQDFPSTINFVGEEGKLYTLVMQDPDAPSGASPTSRSFLHLIKPNLSPLPASALDALGSAGVDIDGPPSMVSIPEEDLMPWRAPGPGKGSGAHRYVFLLIAQPSASASGEKLTFPPDHKLRNAEPEGRRHFDVGKFVSEEMGEGAEVVGLTWFVVEAEK